MPLCGWDAMQSDVILCPAYDDKTLKQTHTNTRQEHENSLTHTNLRLKLVSFSGYHKAT